MKESLQSSDYGSCKDDDGVEEEEKEKDDEDDDDDDDDDNCNINDGKSLFSYVKRKSFAFLQRVQRPRINGPPPRYVLQVEILLLSLSLSFTP